jgi:hypothetical protein
MVNRPKILGTSWESAVVAYLLEHGFPQAERRVLAGGVDKGDLINAGPYVWECKNTATIDLAGGIDETLRETDNAKARFGFLVIKRRRKSTADGYVVMTLKQLCEMIGSDTIG